MEFFTQTGFHKPTLTSVEDPKLQVFFRDNGHDWQLRFEVDDTVIDLINLEYPKGKVHEDVLKLKVICEHENKIVGTVESILRYAIDVTTVEAEVMQAYIETQEHLEQ